jgi:hypothetical protein
MDVRRAGQGDCSLVTDLSVAQPKTNELTKKRRVREDLCTQIAEGIVAQA